MTDKNIPAPTLPPTPSKPPVAPAVTSSVGTPSTVPSTSKMPPTSQMPNPVKPPLGSMANSNKLPTPQTIPQMPPKTAPLGTMGTMGATPMTPPPSTIFKQPSPPSNLPSSFPSSSSTSMPQAMPQGMPQSVPQMKTSSAPLKTTPAPLKPNAAPFSPLPPLPPQPGKSPIGRPQMPTPGPTQAQGQAQGMPLPGGVPKPQTLPGAPAATQQGKPLQQPLPSQQQSQSPQPAKPAEYKKSPFRFLPFVLGAAVILGIGYFVFSTFFKPHTQSVSLTPADKVGQGGVGSNGGAGGTGSNGTGNAGSTGNQVVLNYWGLWEDNAALQDVFADFEQSHPGITINYQQQSYHDYHERLDSSIANGTGPDIFRFHASWVPMLKSDLSPMPSSVMTTTDFQNTFYPIAAQQLTSNNQILGVPLMFDGLALFYNVDALKAANAQPPKTWAELKDLASQLTIRSNGQIQRGGLAIGNSTNVDNFSDILGLLMLQNGADPTKPTSQAAIDAITFYTNFVKNDKVWDASLPNSTIAFARGDVAMIFAPSWRAHDIIAQNPNLKFGVAQVPQLAGNRITWASYWAEGVSAQSKHKNEAWQLIQFMSSAQEMQKFYSAASKERSFGELYSRRDLAPSLSSDAKVSPFLADAPFAQDWYLNGDTHDGPSGINDQMIKYYQDAVTAVLNGTDPKEAMNTVAKGTAQVLRQYNLTTSP